MSEANSPSKIGISSRVAFTTVAIIFVGGLVWASGLLGESSIFKSNQVDVESLQLTTASKQSFLFELSVTGAVDSRSIEVIASHVEGEATILKIVPEGTIVDVGEVVCELDSSELRDSAQEQEIAVTQAQAAMEQAIEAHKIQEKQNESDIAAAKLQWQLAKLDLQSFVKGEFPQQQNQLSANVVLASETLLRNEERYEYVKEQMKKGFLPQDELEKANLDVKTAELEVKAAKEELRVLNSFTKKRKQVELEANAVELGRELDRVKLAASSALTQLEADVTATKLTHEIALAEYEHTLEQIEHCLLKAPTAGQVVYANLSGPRRRRMGGEVIIEEGATIQLLQPVIVLPDMSQMKIDCQIHESLITHVRKGLSTRIKVDAFPDDVFRGVITEVGSVPTQGRGRLRELLMYDVEIDLGNAPGISKLSPGLTATVEIEVDRRRNVLQIPISSIATLEDSHLAVVVTDDGRTELREIKIGAANQSRVEILSGVEEGEKVVSNPRSHFAEQIAEFVKARASAN